MLDSTADDLSDYERLRLEKIKRNRERLQQLGLGDGASSVFKNEKKTKLKGGEQKRRKRTPGANVEPTRRSSRKRKALSYRETGADDEEHSEYSEDEQETDRDDDEETYVIDKPIRSPRRKRSRRTDSLDEAIGALDRPEQSSDQSATSSSTNQSGGVTFEFAKTGRSTCRGRCGNKIPKGAPRIGMQAWIVGRQAVTWQCPTCFLDNVSCAYETSGRGRCKASNRTFKKHELKVGTKSHTATSYYKVEAVGPILDKVMTWVPSEKKVEAKLLLEVDNIKGSDRLSEEDRNTLKSVLDGVVGDRQLNGGQHEMSDANPKQEHIEKKAKGRKQSDTKDCKQPKAGVVSRSKGKVQWKFGGYTCYGVLIPNRETKTHCFAKTHKGNIKTLSKGLTSWSMVLD